MASVPPAVALGPTPPRRQPAWQRTAAACVVVPVAVAAMTAVFDVRVAATAPPQPPAAATHARQAAWASSQGSASMHAYATDDLGTSHLVHIEAAWDAAAGAGGTVREGHRLRQIVQVQVRDGVAAGGSVEIDDWASDLPGARLEPVAASPGLLTFAVTSDGAAAREPGRRYRTLLFVRSRHNLDGARWYYSERAERAVTDLAGATRVEVVAWAAVPRTGVAGWCNACVAEWRQPTSGGAR